MKRLLHVVGARPNFMKAEPVMRALRALPGVEQILVHTGQHFSPEMSEVFFAQLGLPRPHAHLEAATDGDRSNTAQIMLRLEPVYDDLHPDVVMVYGDVNSTAAAALVAARAGIPVAHIEAGLRSFDRSMPEEINRIITDQLAALLLTPSADGNTNLVREGIAPERIHLVGNVMIDTLVRLLPIAEATWPELGKRLDLPRQYGLVTLHRPSNVDDPVTLARLIERLTVVSADLPLIFPVHPRTRERLQGAEIKPGIRLLEPLPYLEFLALQRHATAVLTDSGGIQEETTFLKVPCFTLRKNTERPVTVTIGTNRLVDPQADDFAATVLGSLNGKRPASTIPPLWDGQAGERVAAVLRGWL